MVLRLLAPTPLAPALGSPRRSSPTVIGPPGREGALTPAAPVVMVPVPALPRPLPVVAPDVLPPAAPSPAPEVAPSPVEDPATGAEVGACVDPRPFTPAARPPACPTPGAAVEPTTPRVR